jgi:hypothetical protein
MKEQFREIIQSKDLKEISMDILENVLDNNIANDVLKEIPVLKSIVAVKNLYSSYTDRIFIKKAIKAMLELGEISIEDREKFIIELNDADTTGAEKILLAINHLQDFEKCKIYGRLCKLRITQKINIDEFLRLTKLIQDAYINDLVLITDFKKGERKEIHEGDYYTILSLGLIYQEPSEQMPITQNKHPFNEYEPEFKGGEIYFNYILSDLGEILLEIYHDLFPK